MMRWQAGVLAAVLAVAGGGLSALAQEVIIPNASFEEGDAGTITHWVMEHGEGRPTTGGQDGSRAALVAGDTGATSYWRSEALDFAPRSVYAMHFRAKRVGEGGGPPVAGPVFSNLILYSTDIGEWTDYTLIFQTPDDMTPERAWLRLGQARMLEECTVEFDDVRIFPVQPVHARQAGIELGNGERIDGNRYYSSPPWSLKYSNTYRALHSFTNTVYNHNAFLMGDGSQVVFRYEVNGRRQLSASLALQPEYHFDGRMIAEASTDGETWHELHRYTAREGEILTLPEAMFPAEVIWIRVRCEADEPVGIDFELGAVGLATFGYQAELDGDPIDFQGSTRFVEVIERGATAHVSVASTGDLVPFGANTYELDVTNPSGDALDVAARIVVEHDGQTVHESRHAAVLPPAATSRVALPYHLDTYGKHAVTVTFEQGIAYAARSLTYASPLYASGYGERLPGSNDAATLWSASSAWKVARNIPAPDAQGDALRLALARNETEAVQLVVRPARDLTGFLATAGDLEGPDGGVIPAGSVDVLRVRYVNVTTPTDRLGAIAPWPEPLPPFRGPIDLVANQNQPLWIRVRAEEGLPAGIYHGEIHLTADGYDATVPLEIEVYGFTLPREMTMETAFGASEGIVAQYHRLDSMEDRRAVWEMYLDALAAYHLSPYNPVPFESITVEWPPAGADPSEMTARIDWEDWAREMERVFEKYPFNTFRFPMPGLAGSKYPKHRREIAGFQGDTPEFRALFNSYASQIEALFREKGWLDKAYIYWFDEPYDNDIPFVQSGFQLLMDAAPGLRRMIAVNSAKYLPALEGYVNMWCPQINAALLPFVDRRHAEGDRFWWYVCTNPKEPYPGLFIDHPGVNMRVWSWMTWGSNVEGLLVWATVRWHSNAAHPDALQNPYEDPMTWQGDAGPGVRSPYGNGDGVFFYPPESVFEGGDGPVLEPPVGSMRGEMLRDGIEDYEYFAILRRLLDEKGATLTGDEQAAYRALLTPPGEVYTDRRSYSFDPAPLEAHRDKLARAIVAIQARLD